MLELETAIRNRLDMITTTNCIFLSLLYFTTEQKTLRNRCDHLAKLRHYTCPERQKFQTEDTLKEFQKELEKARNSDAFQQSAGGTGLNIFERIRDSIIAFFTGETTRFRFFRNSRDDIDEYLKNSLKKN